MSDGYYTMEEASKKVCPVLTSMGVARVGPRKDTSTYARYCLPAVCIMWRQEKKVLPVNTMHGVYEIDDGYTDRGYCGLAGKP